MTKNILFILTLSLAATLTAEAQEVRSSSSMFLMPQPKSDVSLTFDVDGEGKRFTPTWGLDQAWINESNLLKGINHMGKENIEIGRTAFRFSMPLTNDTQLPTALTNVMKERASIFDKLSTTLPLVFTADQEAGTCDYYVVNKVANVDHWAANINAHVEWMQKMTKHPIVGVSPYNEGDYWEVEEGASPARHRDVARILKEQYAETMKDVAIVGGNTLNDDKAWNWFITGQDYYDWGNTHQLAGSFDNYAAFYTNLAKAGKVGYNDEMHNVGEAMIGLEYGMTVGIWWGFDSRARGEFCQFSKHGERLAYGEHRPNWTAASVYRHDDGRVKAFVGSSERQAKTTTYQFVSADRDVYFDGFGPTRVYRTELLGGTGYGIGQTNAERVIDVTWGEDVAPSPITAGVYKLVNKGTGSVLTSAANAEQVKLGVFSATNRQQQWTVKPATNRTGGDLSFYDIESVENANIRLNVRDFSKSGGAAVIAYTQDNPTSNEQWYFEYAGDGYYFIRNRESALYLAPSGAGAAAPVQQRTLAAAGTVAYERLKWRLLPVDVKYDTDAPRTPANLIAECQSASVRLTWDAVTNADLQGYMVLRSEQGQNVWNTIARQLTATYFVDNTIVPGTAYEYKVKAVDQAQNISVASEAVAVATTVGRALIAHWQMDDNLLDETPNMMDAAYYGTPKYTDGHQDGSKALVLLSTSVQLPYAIANSDELTVSMWVNWRSFTSWQRLFDFGNDTDHYLFLTPSNGTGITFCIKNGGNEQTIVAPQKLSMNEWKHVCVSIGNQKTSIYVDGVEVASSTGITIKPSDICPSNNNIGRSQFTSDPSLLANIDDVRVYNYALSADDVKAVMQNTYSGIDAPESMPARPAIYSIDGKRLDAPRKGLNIVGGKKVILEK